MFDDITATMVLWNEEARVEHLIETLKPYFSKIVVGVQDSTDRTLELAESLADTVVRDRCHGFGDATYGPMVLPLVKTEWSFKVDGDELPTLDLLDSLGSAANQANLEHRDAVWIPFRSWIDDIEWKQSHGHIRLFRTRLGWPGTLHSRPPTDNVLQWPIGFIDHRKSLDEHVRGYLKYLDVSGTNSGWITHNKAMIYHSCFGTAQVKGWKYVQSHPWWPDVAAKVFGDGIPAVPEA